MITLKRVEWSDCFSYGKNNYIQLDGAPITQIIGVNGSGKSSIPLIIEEALFNKNSKGIKKADIPNRHTTKDSYEILLEFSVGAVEYVLEISRKSTVKVKLLEGGVDVSSHTATNTFKYLSELLGWDYKTFSQIFYQSTNTSLQFLTATDTNRKKFLIDLLHLEEYVAKFEVFKEAAKDASIRVAEVESKLSTVQKWLDSNKLETTQVLDPVKIEISTAEDEIVIQKLSEELANIASRNRKISINNDNKSALNSIDIQANSGIEAQETISYDEEQAAIGAIKQETSTLNASISRLTKLGDQCPTCEQPIASEFKAGLIADDARRLEQLKADMAELEAKVSAIKLNNEQYNKKVQTQRQWEELYRSIDKSLPDSALDKADLELNLTNTRRRLEAAKAQIEELTKENNRRIKHNTRVQVVQEQGEKFQAELAETSIQLDKEVANLSILELLKKSFSTNGLIAHKIENMVKTLEDEANEYLAELSDGRFTIEFVVTNDKLNVEITDFSKTVDILALSTGELGRVNTATLLAIRKLMSTMSKNKLNVLFLDEVISVLDDAGKERLVEVLLKEDLNTFIVSHGWTHPLLDKLEVIKSEDRVSRLER
jgi:DNA repair exonuclease SbcCD ATPase subunit